LAQAIPPLHEPAMAAARSRQDSLTNARGSLGRLEELSIQLAGITGRAFPSVARKVVIVMAADHGVTRQGLSAYPAEVTAQMVLNILAGGTAVNVLSRQAGARVAVVDIGVAADLDDAPGLFRRKVARGTADFTEGPAMTVAQATEALQAGVIMAAASRRIPVVIDGFASGAAALIAVGLAPRVKPYLIASHRSEELGHAAMLNLLGVRPLLDLDLRLGEGTPVLKQRRRDLFG